MAAVVVLPLLIEQIELSGDRHVAPAPHEAVDNLVGLSEGVLVKPDRLGDSSAVGRFDVGPGAGAVRKQKSCRALLSPVKVAATRLRQHSAPNTTLP